MQEVPCHKEEEVMATRWSFFGEKWKTTTEVPGIASMVLLRQCLDLLDISQSGKATLKMKLCAFIHMYHSLQKCGYQFTVLLYSSVQSMAMPGGHFAHQKKGLLKKIKNFI